MMYRIETVGDTTIVNVDSDVDVAGTADFESALLLACDARTKRLIVSLERCEHFADCGVDALLGVRKKCWIPISVVAPPSTFSYRVFLATDLARFFNVAGSLSEALAMQWHGAEHRGSVSPLTSRHSAL